MPDYPLLVFPQRSNADERPPLSGGPDNINYPDHETQKDRLNPRFEALQKAMESKMAEFISNPSGVEPEEVLIFEIAGSVNSFLSICKNTPGLEWMADVETDKFLENDLFYKGEEPDEDKSLRGRLLFTMSNQEGISNLLSMWENWKSDENYNYERGLNGWKELFPRIKEIRKWGVKERFEETGVLEDWQLELEQGKNEITFEIELWFKNDKASREQSAKTVSDLINNLDGSILKEVIIPEINYHALLAKLSSNKIDHITDNNNVEIVKCDQIMFFRPTGQSIPKFSGEDSGEYEISEETLDVPETDEVDVALLDGLPIQNHQLLKDYLIVDDPDNFEESYPVKSRRHGTSMASIILHGDLNREKRETPLKPIYVRPIFKYDEEYQIERVPRDRLLVDILFEAITEMFSEVYTYGEPRSPNTKVINLSVGDYYRPFYNELSSVARLLDWLSFKYNVLFLVSAGNHRKEIRVDTEEKSIDELSTEELQKKTLLNIHRDQRNRRLIAPAESINSITIGASHSDSSNFNLRSSLYNLIQNDELPSPINPVGAGFSRSVKPEVLMPGGKILYRMNSQSNSETSLKPLNYERVPPGIKVAYPGTNEGDLNAVAYTSGTSNATAMASNFSSKVIEVLRELNEEGNRRIPEHYFPVLVKTLIAHTSSWNNKSEYLRDLLSEELSSQRLKDGISRLIGFGSLSHNRAYECDVNRASILGFGELTKTRGHIYDFPLPTVLSGKTVKKRITITLAWFSPVNSNHQNYRKAHLYFVPPMNDINVEREETHAKTAKRGTIQHEVLEGSRAEPIVEGQNMGIKVSCREDASILNERIKYGLCITLETPDDIDLPIYEQVKQGISVPVEVRAEG